MYINVKNYGSKLMSKTNSKLEKIKITLDLNTLDNLDILCKNLLVNKTELITYLINKEIVKLGNKKINFIEDNFTIKKINEIKNTLNKMKQLVFKTIYKDLKTKINKINQLILSGNEIEAKKELNKLEKETTMPELLYAIKEAQKDDTWKKYNEFLAYFK